MYAIYMYIYLYIPMHKGSVMECESLHISMLGENFQTVCGKHIFSFILKKKS